jgi:Transcriptional regulator
VTLVEAGWVVGSPEGRYSLSARVATLGNAALEQARLGTAVRGAIEELARQSREDISLAVIDASDALIVQRVESSELIRLSIPVGTRMPLAHSACGLILLANSGQDELMQLARRGVEIPPETVLQEIRRVGVAVVADEAFAGVAAAAAPLIDASGRMIAALAVTAPTFRFDRDEAVRQVAAAAARIGNLLGARSGDYAYVERSGDSQPGARVRAASASPRPSRTPSSAIETGATGTGL